MKTTILILMGAAMVASAADNLPGTPPDKAAPAPKLKTPNTQLTAAPTKAQQPAPVEALKLSKNFRGGEFQVDAFGVMSRPNLTTAKPVWGAGVGASYYITKGLGFGIRGVAYETGDWGGSAFDEGEARILLRVPLWDRFAPYGFVSGNYRPDDNEWGAGSGGGLELRLNKRFGVFGETGLKVTTEGRNDWSTSAGLRVIF